MGRAHQGSVMWIVGVWSPEVQGWSHYFAEPAFQPFLIKTPSRGHRYISEVLKSISAPTMSLGFILAIKMWRIFTRITIPVLLLGVELMDNSFNLANLTKAHIH